MSGLITNSSISPLMDNGLVCAQRTMDQSSDARDAARRVQEGAKDIYQTNQKAVEDQVLKRLSIITWGRRVVSKCGFLTGCSLMLLISPFLILASFLYDGCRGIKLVYRKITKIPTAVEKLLPKAEKHVDDVEQLLKDKVASDSVFQAQVAQLREEKVQAEDQVNSLQWRNGQLGQKLCQLQQDWQTYYHNQQNQWQQAESVFRGRAEGAEQQLSELTRQLDQFSTDRNKDEQKHQTEIARLSTNDQVIIDDYKKKVEEQKADIEESKRDLAQIIYALIEKEEDLQKLKEQKCAQGMVKQERDEFEVLNQTDESSTPSLDI